ncbi:NUDIX hydrolase [Allobranchiibius sp. CTAmp26]|uniref:NUDIX hydrolase n=1 Tax=Allobranchiibius sp. CTAmp26 TaxID=2815214 RepID=UPI001AA1B218|nr:NUDIX domain-containing protein [Allobranchiibius sp. CTAmp26]MBO1755735.1 NUDIX domain-containing protein [Allobranchiibius sp. CTAmp26]
MSLDPAYEKYVPLASDARSLLAHHVPNDPAQLQLRGEFVRALALGPEAMWRGGPPDHFTASMFVLDARGENVCLVLHKKARLWLQPGGHLEPGDRSVADAALREATEETGLAGLRPRPGLAHLSHHELSSRFGRCRSHRDLRFLATAPPGALPHVSDESDDVRWWPVRDLPRDTDPELRVVVPQLADLS